MEYFTCMPQTYFLQQTFIAHLYWAIQAGLLTPLTSAQHRLSPLAAFPSSVYFLPSGRWWQWMCKFYTANFKDIFGGS